MKTTLLLVRSTFVSVDSLIIYQIDEDYIPVEESSDDDKDPEFEKELLPGEIESVDSDGRITVVQASTEDKVMEVEEADVTKSVRTDNRFEKVGLRRKLRFGTILKKGKVASNMDNQSIIDCSDTSFDQQEKEEKKAERK